MVICGRHHFFEITDETWFPQFLREKVQACLTLLWTFRVPVLQRACPAQLVSVTIARTLGAQTSEYTYVDFCAGAGGPTPIIEKYVNQEIAQNKHAGPSSPVQFLLTDLYPHVEAWEKAVKKSDNLGFVRMPVDATNAPKDLLQRFEPHVRDKKQFRMFNLAFHHFDDDLAVKILENCLETSDGFGIFELQERTLPCLIMISLTWPLLMLLTPFFFYDSPLHLVFTYLCPIVPFVIVFDGYVSSIRTRTPKEVMDLLRIAATNVAARTWKGQEQSNGGGKPKQNGHEEQFRAEQLLDQWKFMSGSEMHTVPIGTMSWVMCIKEKGDEPRS